jgi:DNA modification methylase
LTRNRSLAEQYVEPPFSTLNTQSQRWQERKNWWINLGIQSHLGRGDNLLGFSETVLGESGELDGTSIFDPVLCELMYRWYSPENGTVLDPFAGGSVRGVVAACLGRDYVGIDVNEKQVEHNRQQWNEIRDVDDWGGEPRWIAGDSKYVLPTLDDDADFLFSCPPYYALEQYTDRDDDLSNAPSYDEFASDMRDIIQQSYDQLAPNSFAAWVVGEIRNDDGTYHGFVPDTIEWFRDAGFRYENELVLETSLATAGMRARRQFDASRRVVKTHQNVLVFCKGDANTATDQLGNVQAQPEDENAQEFF